MIALEINVKMAAPVLMVLIHIVALVHQTIPVNIVNRMSTNVPLWHQCVKMEQLAPIHLVLIHASV